MLSATLPDALAELVREALASKATPVVGPPGTPRHRIRLRDHALTDDASVHEITASIEAGRSVLVVANNVAHAQALFDSLAPVAKDLHGDDAAALLHSRFKRGDRLRIERRLSERYGANVAERRPGLIVATQVVEVSLDLDLDVLYTAGAPLEALLQRFGRVNRRGRRDAADVVICQPGYAPRRDSAAPEYADGVYLAEPVKLGWEILRRNDGQPVDETEATGWLNEVYTSAWGEQWRNDVRHHRREFTEAFLTFTTPLDARGDVEERFESMFEGTEAVLRDDLAAYADALGPRADAAGRLLGEEMLIPLPPWANSVASYDKRLRVRVIDGEYHPEQGLLSVRPVRGTVVYEPGEVL